MVIKRAGAFLSLGLCLVSALSILAALEWPLEDPSTTSLFGSSDRGQFSTSIGLDSEKSLVLAADEGELAFVYDEGRSGFSRLPSTLGSFMIVEHPRGNGSRLFRP